MGLTLVKRNETWHIGGINDHGIKVPRHSTKKRDEESALDYKRRCNTIKTEWSEEALKQALEMVEPPAPAKSLADAKKDYLETFPDDQESTRTQYDKNLQMRLLDVAKKDFGVVLLKDLTDLHLEKIQNQWAAKYKRNTIGTYRSCTSSFLNYCFKKGWIAANPWKRVKTLKRKRGDKGIATLPIDRYGTSNWDRIREAVIPYLTTKHRRAGTANPLTRNPEIFLALLELMYYTGLRRSDALVFEPDLTVPTRLNGWKHKIEEMEKTGGSVTLFPPDWLVKKLKSLPRLDPKGQYLFYDRSIAKPEFLGSYLNKPLAELGKFLSIPGLRPHRFRDSFAVNMLNKGILLEQLQLMLGHKNLKTTQDHYAPFVESREENLERIVMSAEAGLLAPPVPAPTAPTPAPQLSVQ